MLIACYAESPMQSKPLPIGHMEIPKETPHDPTGLDTSNRRDRNAALRMIRRAVNEGWQIPEAVYRAAPAICARMLADEMASPRDRLRAAEVLAAMVRDKVNAAIALDKMERLEGGQATDRIVVTPEIAARAREIIERRGLTARSGDVGGGGGSTL